MENPAFIVIDGVRFRVKSFNPEIKEFRCGKHNEYCWHISEVDKVLDIDGEVIYDQ